MKGFENYLILFLRNIHLLPHCTIFFFFEGKNVETVANACINRIILGECYFKGKYAKNERGSILLEAKFSVNVLDLLGTG